MIDPYEKLTEALMDLQDLLSTVGPDIELVGLQVRDDRYQLERAIKMSPTFARDVVFMDQQGMPPGSLARMVGVLITRVPKE